MSKRLFQVLDEMNQLDSDNGTILLQICGQSNVIAVNKKGKHGVVEIGVPENIPVEIMAGKDLRLMLCIIDGEKYDELNKPQTP